MMSELTPWKRQRSNSTWSSDVYLPRCHRK